MVVFVIDQYKKNRIEYLQKTYKDTNIAKGEILPKTREEINRRYYRENIRKSRIQGVLNECNISQNIEKEVHYILESVENIKQLCSWCKEEQIIAVVILFVQRRYNTKLREERTGLWRKYDLTWKIYGRVVSNLLKHYRENSVLPRNVG